MNDLKKHHRKLIKAIGISQLSFGAMEVALSSFITFDFNIENMPGDGLCILNYNESRLSPLDQCIDYIIKHGSLSADDHSAYSI